MLVKLVEWDMVEGGYILDCLQVQQGFEKVFGVVMVDDLCVFEVDEDGLSGWYVLL